MPDFSPQRRHPNAKPSPDRLPQTSVLPKPTLVGLVPKDSPNTPTSLLKGAGTRPKPESSLVGLALKVEGSLHGKKSTGLKPPGAPPTGTSRSATLHVQRHAAEPTDCDVAVVETYKAPGRLDSVTIDLSNSNELWEEVEVDPFAREGFGKLLTGIALLTVTSLILALSAYDSKGSIAAPSWWSRTLEPVEIHQTFAAPSALPPELTVANVATITPTVFKNADPMEAQKAGGPDHAPPMGSRPALTAEMLPRESPLPPAKVGRSAHAKHKRAHAQRRAHKSKVAREKLRIDSHGFEQFP